VRQRDRLLGVAILATALSAVCLWYFAWGMLFMQDLWEATAYVRWLVGGLLSAILAVVAGEALRRSGKADTMRVAAPLAIAAARVMLVIQVIAFLYSNNVGPVRGIAAATVRIIVTYGMARDLPPPPPAS
jgi:hypothetical protein